MKTFFRQFAKTRTEKFWVDDISSSVQLSMTPDPGSVEVWLNGERMTGMAISDILGQQVNLGPLRPGDTLIVNYQPKGVRKL